MRARPTRPLPSANGWMVSNCTWAMAAWMRGGRSSRSQNRQRSSRRRGSWSSGGGTRLPRKGSHAGRRSSSEFPRTCPAMAASRVFSRSARWIREALTP